jgi:hypothetical protein
MKSAAVLLDKSPGLDFNKPVDVNKMKLIDCLNEMLSVFLEVSKTCDKEKIDKFLDAKGQAHRLVGVIGN